MPTDCTSHTRATSIAASPAVVLELVGDALRLPEWAPAFARAVRPDGPHWRVTGPDGAQVRVRVQVAPELGTVDVLAAGEPRGAWLRVVPNGSGSELLFTVLLPDAMDAAQRDAQLATIAGELETVKALCER